MACFETGTVIGMAAREAVTLQNVRGATLRITRGTVWLTQEGSRDDVILRAGDTWMVERDGATVIESQNADSVVCVVGRHVDESASRQGARTPADSDWRKRVAQVFSLDMNRYAPYV